ncbi:UDP-N-acetylmuramoyl-tripeptide--D-alanyl-D-alanine ligase [Candidatus Peregrinibacteria bacterium]|jgi:UDP-N-acetylmuramoyl-tripeptide--D-alanyl-D-alanine ligase|nr:UDP-N-acetylmuramoyl-tripeptide--D-alanyl-D-alanine ligase [Candidatus Peregrinibacteria bacterium]MBT7483267.1 UDP-N-acetylmuramoyl-tripeptide--D-alanyl-D-alanine ligase [Candidatus Peregrinibacteria bacterium]MBT7703360.1 UDP-N-acetylmuramoyl-tripeptide--D-alanyl-D-alanine ligase [Candidatus Peregrinibacteria bacterium]
MSAKHFAKQVVLFLLERLVHWRIRKIQPEIVGITGSVGKTSTKDAIFAALAESIPTHCSKKSYNTEFGAWLTILGQTSGYSSPLHWLLALGGGFISTLRLKEPPYKNLILEMGADKPGDIEYLVKHVKPQIGVFTNVKPMHLAEGQFASLDDIFIEKAKLIRSLPENGWAVLNADDARVSSLIDEVSCNVITFGAAPKADLRVKSIRSTLEGLKFTLHYETTSHEVHFPYLLGRHQAYVMLPAFAVGFLMNLPFQTIYSALRDFRLPPGRMNRIEGIKKTTIIDSSYNASPETVIAALNVLKGLPGRKIAALGSINELGEISEKEHRRVGRHVPAAADLLLTVGDHARYFAEAAHDAGFSKERIFSFETSKAAAEFLKDKLREGDVILAKGSQNNVRMEHLVKELMLHPKQAKQLLSRQDSYWQKH